MYQKKKKKKKKNEGKITPFDDRIIYIYIYILVYHIIFCIHLLPFREELLL